MVWLFRKSENKSIILDFWPNIFLVCMKFSFCIIVFVFYLIHLCETFRLLYPPFTAQIVLASLACIHWFGELLWDAAFGSNFGNHFWGITVGSNFAAL